MTLAMTEPAPTPLEIRRRRLLYRATHRGTYENDLLVGGFARHHIPSMTEPQLDALEAAMELPDADLADWLTGRRPIPEDQNAAMLQIIRAFAMDRGRG